MRIDTKYFAFINDDSFPSWHIRLGSLRGWDFVIQWWPNSKTFWKKLETKFRRPIGRKKAKA